MTVNYSTPSFFASTLTTKGLPPGFTVTLDQNQPWIHVNAPVSQKGGPVSFDITITDGYTCSVGSRCSATATITVTYK